MNPTAPNVWGSVPALHSGGHDGDGLDAEGDEVPFHVEFSEDVYVARYVVNSEFAFGGDVAFRLCCNQTSTG